MRFHAGILGVLFVVGFAGSAAADEAFCNAYADEAVFDAKQAKALGCGYGGARWTTNRADHFNACMGGAGDTRNGGTLWMNEFVVRSMDLAKCVGRKASRPVPFSSNAPFKGDNGPVLDNFCRAYAYISDRQMAGAVRECGFSGPSWTNSFNKNVATCSSWTSSAGSIAASAVYTRTYQRIEQCTGGSIGQTCGAYADRMNAMLTEARGLNCAFIHGTGGWDVDRAHFLNQCFMVGENAPGLKSNERGLTNLLAKCKAGGGTGGGGGGGTKMTAGAEVTMYDTYKDNKKKKDLCYIVPGDTLTLLPADGNTGKWLRLQGNSGDCNGTTGFVYNDGELK